MNDQYVIVDGPPKVQCKGWVKKGRLLRRCMRKIFVPLEHCHDHEPVNQEEFSRIPSTQRPPRSLVSFRDERSDTPKTNNSGFENGGDVSKENEQQDWKWHEIQQQETWKAQERQRKTQRELELQQKICREEEQQQKAWRGHEQRQKLQKGYEEQQETQSISEQFQCQSTFIPNRFPSASIFPPLPNHIPEISQNYLTSKISSSPGFINAPTQETSSMIRSQPSTFSADVNSVNVESPFDNHGIQEMPSMSEEYISISMNSVDHANFASIVQFSDPQSTNLAHASITNSFLSSNSTLEEIRIALSNIAIPFSDTAQKEALLQLYYNHISPLSMSSTASPTISTLAGKPKSEPNAPALVRKHHSGPNTPESDTWSSCDEAEFAARKELMKRKKKLEKYARLIKEEEEQERMSKKNPINEIHKHVSFEDEKNVFSLKKSMTEKNPRNSDQTEGEEKYLQTNEKKAQPNEKHEKENQNANDSEEKNKTEAEWQSFQKKMIDWQNDFIQNLNQKVQKVQIQQNPLSTSIASVSSPVHFSTSHSSSSRDTIHSGSYSSSLHTSPSSTPDRKLEKAMPNQKSSEARTTLSIDDSIWKSQSAIFSPKMKKQSRRFQSKFRSSFPNYKPTSSNSTFSNDKRPESHTPSYPSASFFDAYVDAGLTASNLCSTKGFNDSSSISNGVSSVLSVSTLIKDKPLNNPEHQSQTIGLESSSLSRFSSTSPLMPSNLPIEESHKAKTSNTTALCENDIEADTIDQKPKKNKIAFSNPVYDGPACRTRSRSLSALGTDPKPIPHTFAGSSKNNDVDSAHKPVGSALESCDRITKSRIISSKNIVENGPASRTRSRTQEKEEK